MEKKNADQNAVASGQEASEPGEALATEETQAKSCG
jgi:hypothetical protein